MRIQKSPKTYDDIVNCTFWRYQRCTIPSRSKGGLLNDEHKLKCKKNISTCDDTKITKIRWQNKIRQWTFSLQHCMKLILYLFKASKVHHFTKEQRWAVKWWKWFENIWKMPNIKKGLGSMTKQNTRNANNVLVQFFTTLCYFLVKRPFMQKYRCFALIFWLFHANLRQLDIFYSFSKSRSRLLLIFTFFAGLQRNTMSIFMMIALR